MICPKCGHQRSEKDDSLVPDIQCPACGVFYAKFIAAQGLLDDQKGKPAVFKIDESLRKFDIPQKPIKKASSKYAGDEAKSGFDPENLTKKDVILTTAGVLLMAIILWIGVANIFTIPRFLDKQPTASFYELSKMSPQEMRAFRKKQCEWSVREFKRDPGFMLEGAINGCKKDGLL